MRVKPSIPNTARVIFGLAVLAATLGLKIFYSQATSEELTWIVEPIAFLLELFTDFSFVREAGFGWVDFGHNIVIAPPCAGVNFLIIAFCMSSFLVLKRNERVSRMIAAIVIAGLASYVLTVLACSARIMLSVYVLRFDIYSAWLTSEAVHRAVGVCIYYLFLCFYFHLVYSIFQYKGQAPDGSDGSVLSMRQWLVYLTPLIWYLTFSLGVPFLNGAYSADPESFLWHALWVGGVSLLLTVIMSTAHSFVSVLKNVYRG